MRAPSREPGRAVPKRLLAGRHETGNWAGLDQRRPRVRFHAFRTFADSHTGAGMGSAVLGEPGTWGSQLGHAGARRRLDTRGAERHWDGDDAAEGLQSPAHARRLPNCNRRFRYDADGGDSSRRCGRWRWSTDHRDCREMSPVSLGCITSVVQKRFALTCPRRDYLRRGSALTPLPARTTSRGQRPDQGAGDRHARAQEAAAAHESRTEGSTWRRRSAPIASRSRGPEAIERRLNAGGW